MRHIVILLMALLCATGVYAQQKNEDECGRISNPTGMPPLTVSKALMLGDVDSDGKLTITDVTMLVNYCIGVQTAGFNKAVSDLNHDQQTTITDVIILVNWVIGEGQPQPVIDDENPVIPVDPIGGDPGGGV